MEYKKILLKKIASIDENWLNKKIEYKYFVFFESRNNEGIVLKEQRTIPLSLHEPFYPYKIWVASGS